MACFLISAVIIAGSLFAFMQPDPEFPLVHSDDLHFDIRFQSMRNDNLYFIISMALTNGHILRFEEEIQHNIETDQFEQIILTLRQGPLYQVRADLPTYYYYTMIGWAYGFGMREEQIADNLVVILRLQDRDIVFPIRSMISQ